MKCPHCKSKVSIVQEQPNVYSCDNNKCPINTFTKRVTNLKPEQEEDKDIYEV